MGERKEKDNSKSGRTLTIIDVLKTDKRKIIVLGCVIIAIVILTINFISRSRNRINNSESYSIPNVSIHNVKVHIDFTENLLLSRYDVIFSLGGTRETLTHGESKDIELHLVDGNYAITFASAENSSIKSETKIDVKNDMEVGYKISCHHDNITVENLYMDVDEYIQQDEVKMKNDKTEYVYKDYKEAIEKLKSLGFTNIVEKPMYDIILGWTKEGEVSNVTINGSDSYKRGDKFKKDAEVVVSYHLKETDNPAKKNDNSSKTESNNTTEQETIPGSSVERYNYYTNNDNETAKNGNSGKFSYIKKGGEYDNYWIIDFDNGYVYNFAEGNGDSSYEKIKIKSGNLNDGLELSYKDSSNAWAKHIHFKYKNQPYQLVIVDNDSFNYEFTTTSLEDSLKLMESKSPYEP